MNTSITEETLLRIFYAARTLAWAVEDYEAGLWGSLRRNLDWAEVWIDLAERRL